MGLTVRHYTAKRCLIEIHTKFVLEDYGNKISLQKVKTKNGIAQKPHSKNLGRDRKC